MTAATDPEPDRDGAPPPPSMRRCPTCERVDTLPHHVRIDGSSHHLTCCPNTCGTHWGPR